MANLQERVGKIRFFTMIRYDEFCMVANEMKRNGCPYWKIMMKQLEYVDELLEELDVLAYNKVIAVRKERKKTENVD